MPTIIRTIKIMDQIIGAEQEVGVDTVEEVVVVSVKITVKAIGEDKEEEAIVNGEILVEGSVTIKFLMITAIEMEKDLLVATLVDSVFSTIIGERTVLRMLGHRISN